MNKIKLLLVILTLSISSSFAQDAATPGVETLREKNERDQRVYQLALRYNDLAVARMTLIGLIERNPTNSRYGELLATLYFESNQFSGAALAALDVLQVNDRSIEALEVAAYSLEQIGALDRALTQFERLHLLTDDIFSLYKTAYLQYSLKKHEEALNSINMIVKNTKSAEQKLGFPIENNETQEVSMKAAAFNLKGLVYIEQGSKEDARKAFEEALALEPNFNLAKEGLKGL
ncbi:tetratricopeptide repeat protein [Belliella baltica DSM 15883]|uniref:Tetratricopeptide repeat protein n=1 Tax=Belliella baltica (strain DSM 15883 / CIP 108006 / LMG 21964 / BA134) TaxID=866536 RepID=I3Z8R2_BELBD|nr:tetratricopeptide repeat protein [Belliella baltica]AFL85630.1 tetratricopeptide repeat protein [Belliella baltica DSM 15883]